MKDPASERGYIAAVYAFGAAAYFQFAGLISSGSFAVDTCQTLYRCIEHIYDIDPQAVIDFATIESAAKTIGEHSFLENGETAKDVRAILAFPVKKENVGKFAREIKKFELARNEQQKYRELADSQDADHILATSGNAGVLGDGETLMGGILGGYLDSEEVTGISTGFARLDKAIGGGILPGSLDLIAARLKTGKTWLADNIGLNIASQGVPVLNVDTEMVSTEHAPRIFANLSGSLIKDVKSRNPLYIDDVRQAASRLGSLPYHYVSVAGWSFEQIMSRIRRWVIGTVGLDENGKAKRCVVILDYLKLLSTDGLCGNFAEYQALGFMANELKSFMGQYGVGGLCFVQMNRDGIEREDTAGVGGSDRIAQYGTSLTLYKQLSDEEKLDAPAYTHKLIPVVARHGEGLPGGDFIHVRADYRHGRIIEGPTRYELSRGKWAPTERPETFPAQSVREANKRVRRDIPQAHEPVSLDIDDMATAGDLEQAFARSRRGK